jgi:hypothetical protein
LGYASLYRHYSICFSSSEVGYENTKIDQKYPSKALNVYLHPESAEWGMQLIKDALEKL